MIVQFMIVSSVIYGISKYKKTKKVNSPKLFSWGSVRKKQLEILSTFEESQKKSQAEKNINRNLLISFSSLAISAFVPSLNLISIFGILYLTSPIYKKSYQKLKKGKLGVESLSTITITGCILSNYIVVCNLIGVVYIFSTKLLLMVQGDSEKSLVDVFRQHPKFVWVLVDGVEAEIPFSELKNGHIVVVYAGETIPADGIVTDGIALVDQHVLTGESQPVEKVLGEKVFASSVVLNGKICFAVEQAGQETTVAKIGAILNDTKSFKTETQLKAETMADKTVAPTLILSGLLLPFLGPYRALAIINAHFKYRLAMIAPISTMNFLNVASQNGILIKDGRTFDLLNKVDTIVFDKTGTLTEEQPHVKEIYTWAKYRKQQVLTFAANAEYKQTNPVALAILKEADLQKLDLLTVDDTDYKVGYGLTVTSNQQLIQVGSARFMEMIDVTIPLAAKKALESSHRQGYSLVLIAVNQELIGAIELHPMIRPEAKSIIEQLRQRPNIKSMYIISGDHQITTEKLAKELGIDEYFAEVLPEEKASIIEKLQESGKYICYIGDGINDSIALKKSQVSVSLQGASTVAKDTAQIVLMGGDLKQLPYLFQLSEEFEQNVLIDYICLLIPTIIGIGGAVFFHFGLVSTLMLTTTGLTAGMINSMLPAFKHRNKSSNLITENTASE